ncbi:MraY family glycosyltransferase [Sphingobacterium suaedae]|uniref:MraY family glycosyltransferase n=1 Tax=Sphingobacterium suaedae TaxID=1686402 RepID=A0ABW5KNB5_9SPHI
MDLIVLVLVPFIIAVFLSRMMIPVILFITYKKRLFDPIDARKLHQRIVPRLGGVAFTPIQCCLFVITLVIAIKVLHMDIGLETWAILPHFMVLVCGLVILFIVGIADDLVGVNYKVKFVAQVLVASLFPISGLWINDLYGLGFVTSLPPLIGMSLTIFVVVLIINAINLIDGLDGLCSGVVGLGCLSLGVLFMYYGAWFHALFAFITAGVLIPFFYFNVFGVTKRQRKIFMGDTGSMTLGYSIAFLAISFAMNNYFIKPFTDGAIIVAFSTLIVPVFDVARVMYVRWHDKKPLFHPDRNHLHHKFLRAGMSHQSAMVVIQALALLFFLFNMVAVQVISNNIVVILDVLLWVVFHQIFNELEKRKVFVKHSGHLSIKNS